MIDLIIHYTIASMMLAILTLYSNYYYNIMRLIHGKEKFI